MAALDGATVARRESHAVVVLVVEQGLLDSTLLRLGARERRLQSIRRIASKPCSGRKDPLRSTTPVAPMAKLERISSDKEKWHPMDGQGTARTQRPYCEGWPDRQSKPWQE